MKRFLLSLVTILCVTFTAVGQFSINWENDLHYPVSVCNGTDFEIVVHTVSSNEMCASFSSPRYDGECEGGVESGTEYISNVNFTIIDSYTFIVTGTAVGIGSSSLWVYNDPSHMYIDITVVEAPSSSPTIFSLSGGPYSISEEYEFTASSGDDYLWSATPDSYEIIEGETSSNVKMKFTEAGDYSVTCHVYYTGYDCPVSGSTSIEVTNGATQQDITYEIKGADLCLGGNMLYSISASEPITSTLVVSTGQETYSGYSKGDNVYIFDLTGLDWGAYLVSILDVDNGNELLGTATIQVNSAPNYPMITSSSESFLVGETYTFDESNQPLGTTYSWHITDGNYEFVGDPNSQTVSIKFNDAGSYDVWCQVTDNFGCSSSNYKTVEVSDGGGNPSLYEFLTSATYCLYGSNWNYYVNANTDITGLTFTMEDTQTSHSITGDVNGNDIIFDISAFAWEEGTYSAKITDDNGNVIGTPYITITTSGPSVRIANWSSEPVVGQPVMFMDERYQEGATYIWSVVDTDEQDYTVSTEEQWAYFTFSKTGTYTVKCTGYYGSSECSSEDTWGTFTVLEGTNPNPTADVMFCEGSSEMNYIYKDGKEGQSYSMSIDGVEIRGTEKGSEFWFDVTQFALPLGYYEATIKQGTQTVATLTIAIEETFQPSILSYENNFTTGNTYTFYNEQGSPANWNVTGGTNYQIVSDPTSGVDHIEVIFYDVDTYYVSCEVPNGSCSGYDSFTVVTEEGQNQDGPCTADGVTYFSLEDAFDAVSDGGEIVVYEDIEGSGGSVSKDFTLNLKGHSVTLTSLSLDNTVHIIGGGSLTTSLYGSSSANLVIYNSTVTTVPNNTLYDDRYKTFRWEGNIEIANNGVLEVQDSVYFGGDEGFTLNIDGTSQMIINAAAYIHAADYETPTDTTRALEQIRQYLPEGATASVSDYYDDNGYGYQLFLSNSVLQGQTPAVVVSFPQDEYHITIGDSVLVCLDITSEEPDFNLEDVSVSFEYIEADVQFIEDPTGTVGCTYIKAIPGGSWAEVTATVTYNGKEYYASTEVYLEDAPLTLHCPEGELNVGDEYEMQINEYYDLEYHTFTWASSNESVAVVDQLGTVTCVAPGVVTITCTATSTLDESVKEVTECMLTIKKKHLNYYVSPEELSICLGDEEYEDGVTIEVYTESDDFIHYEDYTIVTADGKEADVIDYEDEDNVTRVFFPPFTTPGEYTYKVMDDGVEKASFSIIVNSLPIAEFNQPLDTLVGSTWEVQAVEGEGYYYEWTSDYFSDLAENSPTQTITFESEGYVDLTLTVYDENECTSTQTHSFTILEGEQTYNVPEEVTWCHGAEGGHVAFTVTSNKDIPESLTVNHDWASNVQVTVYGKEASIEFDYPYAGRQGFQLITINDDDKDGINDTTVVVENVNAYGRPYLQANIDYYNEVDTIVNFLETDTIALTVSCLETLNTCTSCGAGATFSWFYDDASITGECLEWVNPDNGECNNSKMKFTFAQAGTYTFEAQTHQDGCSSEWTSKTIYVVPFNPVLFSIAPEKDTIEIGAPNGAQFTLNYDGEPYSNYTLKSDGDVTIDGTSVFDNEIVGTFEIYAEVGGLRVATAWITVIEKPIEYTVENVSVCEGTDEAEAVIYASGSIYGKSVTVRDEEENVYWPEYNEKNDGAILHLNYLSVGTYTFKVYEDDVYKTEFTVRVNSLPNAYIECPVNPVVGDTWSPNTAMQEGMTYHWYSDNIASLNESTSCCPRVTFTEAGDFSATLVVKNDETGCLSEGATCEFTVGEKAQEYFLNCPDGDLSLGESYYVMFLNAGDVTGKTLTWSTNDSEIVTVEADNENGQCIVNLKRAGTAQIYCQVAEPTGEVLETVACTLNIVEPKAVYFEEYTYTVEVGSSTTLCLSADGLDLSNAQITYESSNDKILTVEPSAAATSCAVVTPTVSVDYAQQIIATVVVGDETYTASADVTIVEPFVCEGMSVSKWTSRDIEVEEGRSAYMVDVEGVANFDGTIKIVIGKIDETSSVFGYSAISEEVEVPVYKNQSFGFIPTIYTYNVEAGKYSVIVSLSSWNEGNQVCFSKLEVTKQDQECSPIAFEYSKTGQNYTLMRQGVTSSAVAGDTFTVAWEGIANFTGYINVALIDQSAEAGYWAEVSEWDSFEVEAGVPFYFTKPYVVTEAVSSAPEIGLFATIDEQVDDASVCETYFVVTKQEEQCYGSLYYDSFEWYDEGNLLYHTTPKVGDEYAFVMEGTSYFDGTVTAMLANINYNTSDVTPLSESVTIKVEAGKQFSISESLVVASTVVSEGNYASNALICMVGEGNGEEICVTKISLVKQNVVYSLSESQFTMFVGSEKYLQLYADGAKYFGDVEWNVYDLSGSTTPCINVNYGEVYAQAVGQAKIEAKINGNVVATAIVTVSEFDCEGQLYIVNEEVPYFTVKSTSEITAGETYRVELSGTTDFDGVVIVTCGDFSSEEPERAAGMGETYVQAGVPFTYSTLLTIQSTTSSAPEYKFMVALAGENEESRLCATKLEFNKFESQYAFDAPQYELYVGGSQKLTLKNIDGTVYGGDAEWYSSDEKVVKVQNGYAVALSEGPAEIQAFVGGTLVASTMIVVTEPSGISMWFDEAGYTFSQVGEEKTICLNAVGLSGATFTYQYNQEILELTDAPYGTNCKIVKALKPGRAMVSVSAEYDGETYTASYAVEVKGGSTSNDYTLAFAQSKYEITEGESIRACLTIGEGFEHFDPSFTFDDEVISIANPTDHSDCGVVTGLKAGSTTINLSAVAPDGKTYTATTEVIVNAKGTLNQMVAPILETDMITLCYSKNTTSEEATSLDEYVQVTNDNAQLKWYDATGNELESAPVIDSKSVGKRIYYVSQVASGYTESDKKSLAVNILYVAAPELNIYEQKVCDNSQTQAFVAKSQNNEIYWYQGEGNPVAQGNTFMPTEAGMYLVRAIDVANGCVSDFATVNYAVGNTINPEIQFENKEYALGESVALAVQTVDEELYSVVWNIEGSVMQGANAVTSFSEEGNYKIPCTIIEKASGCAASDTLSVSVKNQIIPVTSISVSPDVMELYTNEKGHFAVSFEPSYATNQRYVVTVADTSIAVVSGATVIPVNAGATTLTVASAENADIKAEVSVKVTEYVAARELSLPRIITMGVGETIAVNASVIPSNASKNKVHFMEKSDKSVVEITREGVLTANAEGTAVINAYTEGGLQATSVVYVTSNSEEITSVEVPTKVELKLGDSISVPVKVTPTSLLVKDLAWTIGDEEIVSFNNGVVKALKKGETTLTVSYKSISETIAVVVNSSSAPVVAEIPPVTMNQDGSATVDLSLYVTDENGFEGLDITSISDEFEVSVEDGVLTITPKSADYTGTDTVALAITNAEGLTTEVEVPVTVKETENGAPVVKMHEILFKEGDQCKFIDLADIAEDDMTDWKGLKFTFDMHRNGINNQSTLLTKVMKKTQLRIVKMLSFERDSIFVTVSDGELTTTDTIIVYMGSIPNKAPVISSIPVQNETDETKFGAIDLTRYVTDDYTTPSAMAWTTSASENIAVTVANGVASVKVLNEFWRGAEPITFTAKDEEGAEASATVYYVRNVTVKTDPQQQTEPGEEIVANWEGAPSFDVMAMRTIGVPGDSYVLMASLFGFNGSFEWTVEGAEGLSSGSLMQTVTFAEPGEYDVTLTVMSADGNYRKAITKERMLTVVGIDNRRPEICKGQSITLNATEGMDSYYWTSGDAKESTTVRPGETGTVAVTMRKGLFTFVDSVEVKVSVPVALMEDSVMCRGTKFDLEAQGEFVSYTWSNGATTKSIEIPDVVETYSVMTVDDMQCVSVDTFNLTKVNELPVIDLGEDRTPCDGTTVTLNAGEGYEYLWSTDATTQTIDLTAGTDTVWARIIDGNLCVNYDTVVVAFTYPYPEQIGVATFSETTDHIILAWEKTAGVNTVSYRIERETFARDNWEQVGEEVMFDGDAGIVVDEDVNYKQRSYVYRLVTKDACGNEAVSASHHSMISKVMWQTNGLQTIDWNAYRPKEAVDQYMIFRGTDPEHMDTVDFVPANLEHDREIWNETDPRYKHDSTVLYRVAFRLTKPVDETAVNTLDGQPVAGYYTKAESGPFSLALSNIAEAENDDAVERIAFPADVVVYPSVVKDVINVLIASPKDEEFTVEVVNANGQTVNTIQTGEVQKSLLQIPAGNLTQGIYNVKITTGNNVKVIKVVK